MSDPQRRQVRVRRSPKVGAFLAVGAIVGAVGAVVAVSVAPPDPATPALQALGFLVVLLAPLGALVGGAVALLVDAGLERRARTVEADRLPAEAPEAQPVDAEPDPVRDRTDPS